MAKNTQLEIIWTGPLQSLVEHRVSLSAFADPLSNLLAAARRIASNMVGDALEPASVGRLAKEAHQVDIEISGVIGNSAGVATVMTFQSENTQQPLFNDMPENVGLALLEAIEQEAKGNLKNSGVRRYLQSLPTLLTHQSYKLHENGRSIKFVEIGTMNLPEAPIDLPYLSEITGRIVGVGFEPGKPEIRVKSDDAQVTISATPKQVDKALEYRNSEVHVLFLKHGIKSRLMTLRDTSMPRIHGSTDEFIFKKWNTLLMRLAQ